MKKFLWITVMFILSYSLSSAQNMNTTVKEYYFFPKEKPNKEINYFLGLSMAQLPTKIVEDVFDQVPMIDFKMSYGLPYHFSGRAELSTNVMTNQLTISPSYSVSYKNFSMSAGSDVLAWYGFFNSDGFDVSVLGWGYSPFICVGYDFDDFMLSIKGEINIKAQNTYMKSLQYTKNSPDFVGSTISMTIEQPLWKDHIFALGFRANYSKFFYKSWISFSTFDQYIFYPEFFAGFIF